MLNPKTITIFVVTLLVVLILFGLFKQIKGALDAGKRIELAADEVSKLQDTNRKLRNKLTEVQSYDFLEEIARDKLNLSKPNETIVIIPQDTIDRVLSAQSPVPQIKMPNWQGWLNLFFK